MLLFLDQNGHTFDGIEKDLSKLYAQAVFTTFQMQKGQIPLWPFHWQRLTQSAHFHSLKMNPQVENKILEHLKAFALNEPSRVRVTLCLDSSIIIEINKLEQVSHKPQKLKTASRTPAHNPSYLKQGNYQEAFAQRAELQKKGFDDFLFWDNKSRLILESTVSNIIYCRDSKWYTPHLQFGVLGGSTRNALLELKLIVEKNLAIDEIANCTSMFMINAIKEIVPVESIDDHQLFIDQEMRQLCSNHLHDKMWNITVEL